MRFQIVLKVGETPITLSDEVSSMEEVFEKTSALAEVLPEQCQNCESVKLKPNHRLTKSKAGKPCHYYEVTCKSCGWALALGQRQDGSGLYPKEWGPPYSKGEAAPASNASPDGW